MFRHLRRLSAGHDPGQPLVTRPRVFHRLPTSAAKGGTQKPDALGEGNLSSSIVRGQGGESRHRLDRSSASDQYMASASGRKTSDDEGLARKSCMRAPRVITILHLCVRWTGMRLRVVLVALVITVLNTWAAAAQQCAYGYWCWCETARAYYPYVASCSVPWRPILPRPYGPNPQMLPSVPPISSPVASETSNSYREGAADWRKLQAWFEPQTGDRRAGADFWSANRNQAGHKSCDEAGQDYSGDKSAFIDGCQDAKRHLDPIDAKRTSDSEYRAGFNDEARHLPLQGGTGSQPASTPPMPQPPVETSEFTVNNRTCLRISGIKIDDTSQDGDIGPGNTASFHVTNNRCSHTVHGASDSGLEWNSHFECKDRPNQNFSVNWTSTNQPSATATIGTDSLIVESGSNSYTGEIRITGKLDCVTINQVSVNRGNCKIANPNVPTILKFGQTLSFYYFCPKLLEVHVGTDQGEGTFSFDQ